jgi:hypothetical protein
MGGSGFHPISVAARHHADDFAHLSRRRGIGGQGVEGRKGDTQRRKAQDAWIDARPRRRRHGL